MSERKTANGKVRIFVTVKQRIRHIRARPGEWVRVHRPPVAKAPIGGGSEDWWWKIGLAILGLIVAVEIIKALAPYFILCLIGWVVLKAKIIK